jgi:hypothetical protein
LAGAPLAPGTDEKGHRRRARRTPRGVLGRRPEVVSIQRPARESRMAAPSPRHRAGLTAQPTPAAMMTAASAAVSPSGFGIRARSLPPRWPPAWRSRGAAAAAMAAFGRSGDRHLLESALAPDLRSRMAGRVERPGRDYFATRLAHDFEYGVTDRRCESSRVSTSRSPDCCSTARPSRRSLPARRLRRPASFPLT